MKLLLKTNKEVDNLINEELKRELVETKDKIEKFYRMEIQFKNFKTNKWDYYRSLLNKYETVPKGKGKMNRAYFKLKEMMLDEKKEFLKIKSAACLAEGPGGFIEFLSDFYEGIEIFGITLRYDDEISAGNRNMKIFNNKNIKIIYGDPEKPNHNGDLYKKDVVESFAKQVGKVDLVTADGGFEARLENDKEVEHLKLFLSETLTAFRVLKKDGSFILKIYDIFTRPTLELLFLLSNNFKKVNIVKPVTSRPANSERYVVCLGFKGKPIEEHVDDNTYYSSILNMTKTMETKFQKFIKKIEKENTIYVKRNIDTINNILYFIQNENNEKIKEMKEQQDIYKKVWEKVYE